MNRTSGDFIIERALDSQKINFIQTYANHGMKNLKISTCPAHYRVPGMVKTRKMDNRFQNFISPGQ